MHGQGGAVPDRCQEDCNMRWALIDFGHSFYRPMMRRIIIFGLLVIWTVVEVFLSSIGWVVFFAALSAYVGWGFFLSGQADGPATDAADKHDAPPPDAGE